MSLEIEIAAVENPLGTMKSVKKFHQIGSRLYLSQFVLSLYTEVAQETPGLFILLSVTLGPSDTYRKIYTT